MPDTETRMVIGILTIPRSSDPRGLGYLEGTIESLLGAMSDRGRRLIRIVIIDATPEGEEHPELDRVVSRFGIRLGEVLKIDKEAPLDDAGPTPYLKWRRALTLDAVASLRMLRATNCDYILRLEDDVATADGFVSKILSFADRRSRDS